MRKIFKYELELVDEQYLTVPESAKFVSVIEQNDMPVLYAIVDPTEIHVQTRVLIRGTGHDIDEGDLLSHECLGSVETNEKRLVWHIFVEGRRT